MFPGFWVYRAGYLPWRHIELFANALWAFALLVELAYHHDQVFGEACVRVVFAARGILPALCDHIPHIVCVSSEKEMAWIDTGSNVAMMKNVKAIGDGANMNLIRKAMRLDCRSRDSQRSIAIHCAACPQPAFIWAALVYFLPEALQNGATAMMPTQKAIGFTFYQSLIGFVILVYACFLSATTVAITVWNFKCRIMGRACEKRELWGMLLHVNSPFMTLTTPRDDSSHRLGNSIGCYSFNFSTNGLELQ